MIEPTPIEQIKMAFNKLNVCLPFSVAGIVLIIIILSFEEIAEND